MLGLRGVPLGHPQARAVRHAGAGHRRGCLPVQGRWWQPIVEIMIPLAATREELAQMREELEPAARELLSSQGAELEVLWGTMVELPRAALVAGEIAEVAEFFSFGTNDLTQTAFGFSRDDIGKFLACTRSASWSGPTRS
jgi:pyruvate,orthophosphate dikinase